MKKLVNYLLLGLAVGVTYQTLYHLIILDSHKIITLYWGLVVAFCCITLDQIRYS